MTSTHQATHTPESDLIVGRWYALITREYDDDSEVMAVCRAPLAEYIGDDEFVDEDDHTFRAAGFDDFVLQGGADK